MTPTPEQTQAAITMQMREALRVASRHLPDGPLISDPFSLYQGCPMPTKSQEIVEAALALPVSAAEAQVAEWKRKAEALNKLEYDVRKNGPMILHNGTYPEGQRMRGLTVEWGIAHAMRHWQAPPEDPA